MLAFSVIWLFLAVTVTLLAMNRRSHATEQAHAAAGKIQGNAIVFLAAIYSLALLAGFLYLGKFLVSSF